MKKYNLRSGKYLKQVLKTLCLIKKNFTKENPVDKTHVGKKSVKFTIVETNISTIYTSVNLIYYDEKHP
jgi:hypothetical protein